MEYFSVIKFMVEQSISVYYMIQNKQINTDMRNCNCQENRSIIILSQKDYNTFMKVKVAQSCLTLCDPMDCPWNSPGQNTGVGSLSLLQGIFLTQELNLGLLYCRQILYPLSYQGSPLFSFNIYYLFGCRESQLQHTGSLACELLVAQASASF